VIVDDGKPLIFVIVDGGDVVELFVLLFTDT
jgi:hypothetical protein